MDWVGGDEGCSVGVDVDMERVACLWGWGVVCDWDLWEFFVGFSWGWFGCGRGRGWFGWLICLGCVVWLC